MQRNWIGRSEGAELTFEIDGTNESFRAFTTRPDTIFGATYAVLAPEHKLVDTITTAEQQEAVQAYKDQVKLKSDLERTDQKIYFIESKQLLYPSHHFESVWKTSQSY